MSPHPLKQSISEAMKAALRTRDKARLSALRLMLAELQRVEVDERIELSEDRILAILSKMIKQRRDSASQYAAAGRQELAEAENAEIAVIQEFMPQALDESELKAIVADAIEAAGAASMKDMGAVMKSLQPRLAGRADMAVVSQLVRQGLS